MCTERAATPRPGQVTHRRGIVRLGAPGSLVGSVERRVPVMPTASRSTRGSRSTEAAVRNHPLSRGERLGADLHRQCLVTALALLLGSVATGFVSTWGLPLLIAAGLVQLGLAVSLAMLNSLQHERALEMIIEGRRLPIPRLERELQRLKRPRHRTGLANALDDIVRTAARWPKLIRVSRPVFDPRIVRAAAPELRAIAACMRTNEVSACALARAERLLMSGHSPLYGTDLDDLDHELVRIRRELDHP
jgi:hypothetical protein